MVITAPSTPSDRGETHDHIPGLMSLLADNKNCSYQQLSSPEPQYSNVKSEPTLDGKHSPEVVKAHISLLNHSSLPSSPVDDMGSTSVGADGEVAMAPGSKRKMKVKDDKICLVCGDKALGCNFDAISCESCKAFFRRNALRNKITKCIFSGSCVIDMNTRRFCPHCRLQKCFTIGMKKDLILNDDARRKRSEKVKVNRIKRCRISGPSTITLTSPNGIYGSHGSPQSSQSPPISPTPSTLSTTAYGGELHGEYELSPSPSGLIEESHITMTTSTAPSPGYMLLSESSLAMSGSDVMLSSATDNATTGMINVQPATVNNNTATIIVKPEAVQSQEPIKSLPSPPTVTGSEDQHNPPPPPAPVCPPTQPAQSTQPSPIPSGTTAAPNIQTLAQTITQVIGQATQQGAPSVPQTAAPPAINAADLLGFLPGGLKSMDMLATILGGEQGLKQIQSLIPSQLLNANLSPTAVSTSQVDARAPNNASPTPSSTVGALSALLGTVGPKISDILGISLAPADANREKVYRSLNAEENNAILELQQIYDLSFTVDLEPLIHIKQLDPSLNQLVNQSSITVLRLIKFAKRLEAFSALSQHCQIGILKGVWLNHLLLRSVSLYDTERDVWVTPRGDIPTEILKNATGYVQLHDDHVNYCKSFKAIIGDDLTIVILLLLTLLFSPDGPHVIDHQLVSDTQDKYLTLLKHYLEAKYSFTNANTMFGQLMSKLMELKQLAEIHGKYLLDLNPNDIEPIMLEILDLK